MAYDEGLAERIRERLGADPDIVEMGVPPARAKPRAWGRMFGGIAFLHRGNMAVGATGEDLMVRVGPDGTDAALARPGARLFDMTGTPDARLGRCRRVRGGRGRRARGVDRRGVRLRGRPAAQVR